MKWEGEGNSVSFRGLGLKPRARCAGFSVAEIGNRKECLHDYASFPGFLPLNPLRTPSPPLKRAGTPCTRERGLRLGLTALRGASEGWGYGGYGSYGGYGGSMLLARNQVSLRFLILASFKSLRDLGLWGGKRLGLPP